MTRRALFALPFAFAGSAALFFNSDRPLPDAAENGSGPLVTLVIYPADGSKPDVRLLHKIAKNDRHWREELTREQFSITRRSGTEFAYSNAYWKSKSKGIYRCVCCGTALFRSEDKFDSGTGWPSFTAPAALENITTKPDRTFSVERTEILCVKCDAHLGHLFEDGPPPTGARYCVNSAALGFVA